MACLHALERCAVDHRSNREHTPQTLLHRLARRGCPGGNRAGIAQPPPLTLNEALWLAEDIAPSLTVQAAKLEIGMPAALIAQVERSGKIQPILTLTSPIPEERLVRT